MRGRPRHSQSQGLAERANRTLNGKVAAMKDEAMKAGRPFTWKSWLPQIQYSMNVAWHVTTKDSPYRLVFGLNPPPPLFPGAPKQVVDEEDVPELLRSTADDKNSEEDPMDVDDAMDVDEDAVDGAEEAQKVT